MKTRTYIVTTAIICLAVMSVYAAQEGAKKDVNTPAASTEFKNPQAAALKTEMDKVSYIIGTQIAQNFKSQDIEVNLDSLLWGLKDGLAGKELLLTQDEIQKVYTNFQQQMMAKQTAKRAKEEQALLSQTDRYVGCVQFLKKCPTSKYADDVRAKMENYIVEVMDQDTFITNEVLRTKYGMNTLEGEFYEPMMIPYAGERAGWQVRCDARYGNLEIYGDIRPENNGFRFGKGCRLMYKK